MTNENVKFEVIGIEKAIKPGHVVAKIKFKDNDKVFTYVRKFYVKNFLGVVVIDGCHVYYNLATYEVVKIEYKYETKGMKKTKGGTTSAKIKNELGWYPETTFENGIKKTVEWYLQNEDWWQEIVSGEYMNYYEKMYKDR